MQYILAKPFFSVPLSTQIQRAGGEGFTTSVKVTPVKNSYSEIYVFDTPNGEVGLISLNMVRVALIKTPENHEVYYFPITQEFMLVTINPKDKEDYNFVSLGFDKHTAMKNINALFTNILSISLNIPDTH